jgi:hypothetical protein
MSLACCASRLDRSRVRQGQARVLRESQQSVLLLGAVLTALPVGGNDEAPHDLPGLPDRRRHRALEVVGGERGQATGGLRVVVDDDEPVLGDRAPAGSLADRPPPECFVLLRRHSRGRDQIYVGGVFLVDQSYAGDLVAQ